MDTPLLLLHGALGSAAQFSDLCQHLPEREQALAFHFPGHGGLPTDTEFSIAHFAGHTLSYMDQAGIERARFFGYSMGGYVALYLAWQHPERVESIATLGTKFDWTPGSAAQETARLDPGKIAAKVPAFAQMLAKRHAPADWEEVVRRTAGLLHELGNGAALDPDTFRAISCPVCIGLGDKDNMVSVAESRNVASIIPAGRFDLLEGVPHPFEQTDARVLARWISHNLSGKI